LRPLLDPWFRLNIRARGFRVKIKDSWKTNNKTGINYQMKNLTNITVVLERAITARKVTA
jgi:hypothetical protein